MIPLPNWKGRSGEVLFGQRVVSVGRRSKTASATAWESVVDSPSVMQFGKDFAAFFRNETSSSSLATVQDPIPSVVRWEAPPRQFEQQRAK